MCKSLQLIKLSWNVKINILKCRWLHGKHTDEYRLANYYQDALNNLNNTKNSIKILILETEKLAGKFPKNTSIIKLLNAVISFLHYLESTKK